MKKVERKKLFKKAFDKWGLESQLLMLMEECAELTQSASKVIRYHKNKTSVWRSLIEEIADVEILIEQIETCVDWENIRQRVNTVKYDKLRRLKRVVEE